MTRRDDPPSADPGATLLHLACDLPLADPGAVVAEARRWIGTPYHPQASLHGVGCDCLGLARGVWRALAGPEPLPVPAYGPHWGESAGRELLLEAMRAVMREIEVADAGEGALVLMRMGRSNLSRHLGFLTGAGSIVHARERLGVIEEPLTQGWVRRITHAFLMPGRGAARQDGRAMGANG